jgi:glyoxylase-like metal-dependent hydrolase (beta-lactamase superfamily II)
MIVTVAKRIAFVCAIAFSMPGIGAPAQAFETLKSEQVAENVSVISFGKFKIHTFHGISNSHIIETANELRVVDAQFRLASAQGLKKYISSLGKPLVQIILSHNHPDHWFGARVFENAVPVATSKNITADLKNGGMRYIKIMSKNPKMAGNVPDKVVVPSQEIPLGKQSWDGLEVVVEEHAEQESHHSLLIKIPSHGIMIGQDLFYNGFFLVASERSRNGNWRNLLQSLLDNETKTYKTLLVGHGKNGGPSILSQDVAYLDALASTLEKGLSMEETTKSLIAQFPGKKGSKSFLGISMRNLFKGH